MRRVIRTELMWRRMGSDILWGDKPYEVIVKPFRPHRTLDQNAKMHVMIRELANHIGYSDRELKDFIKSEYGPTKTIQVGEKQKVIPLSTTEYNRQEAGEMIEILYMLGAECGYAFQAPENAAPGDAGGEG